MNVTKKTHKILFPLTLSASLLFASCSTEKQLKKDIAKVLEENPELVISSIKKNPEKYIMALNSAAKQASQKMAQKRQQEELHQFEKSLDNPITLTINKDDAIRGAMSAPITLVEFSDFQCPFCSRGNNVVDQLRAKYGSKIKFVYKHLPLDFHKQALISAKYFEAIKLQSQEKAFKFHDELFKKQRKLENGEKFLKEIAKSLNVNMSKLSKDIHSKVVEKKISTDVQQAHQLGFQGTPGFLLNGVPVKGAYPLAHFEKIIDELVKRRKLKI